MNMSGVWDGEGGSGSAYFNVTEPSGNASLSCAARSIQGPAMLPYPTALTITVRTILAVYYIITTLAGIILNTLVIVLVAKYKKLRTHSFAVALQVVGLDLVRSLIFLVGVVNIVANRWVFGEHVCALIGITVTEITQVRLLLMFVFVTDRYLSVFLPYWYPAHKIIITVGLSVASWTLVIVTNIAFLPGLLDCFAFDVFKWVCTRSTDCSPTCSIAFRIHLALLTFTCTTIPIWMYTRLFCKARTIQKAEATHTLGTAAAKSIQHRERKITITFFLLFISVCAFILPNAIIFIVISTISARSGGDLHPVLYILGVYSFAVLSLLPTVDPIVIMRNQDVREVFTSLKDSAFRKLRACRHNRHQSSRQDHRHQGTCHEQIQVTRNVRDLGDQLEVVPVEVHELSRVTLPNESPAEAQNLSVEAHDSSVEAIDSPVEAHDSPVEAGDTPVEAFDSPVVSPVKAVNLQLEADDSPVDSPVKADDSPMKADNSPVEAVDSPVEAVDSPMKADDLPVEAVDSPVEADDTPVKTVKENDLPVEAHDFLMEAYDFPVEADSSPDSPVEAGDSPVEADNSPVEAVDSPVKADDSPMKADDSPVEAVDSPMKADDLPVEAVDSPVEADDTPVKTVKENDLPVEAHDFLMEAYDFPVEADSSPDSPVEAGDSPVEAIDSPVETIDSPVEAIDSPVEACDSPMEAYDTPMKTHNSPMETCDFTN